MQTLRRCGSRRLQGSLSARRGLLQAALHLADPVHIALQMARLHSQQFIHILHLERGHLKHTPGALVCRNFAHGTRNSALQLGQRVLPDILPDLLQRIFHWQCGALHHGVEQIRLVLEMPVNRAPAHPRRLGNVIQGCAGHAFFRKHQLSRIQQPVAGR